MITLQVSSQELHDEALHHLTHLLVNDILHETELNIVSNDVASAPGDKGDAITIGTIVLAAISTGTFVSLFDVLKAQFSKEPHISVKVEKNGKSIQLNAKNTSHEEVQATLEKVNEILS